MALALKVTVTLVPFRMPSEALYSDGGITRLARKFGSIFAAVMMMYGWLIAGIGKTLRLRVIGPVLEIALLTMRRSLLTALVTLARSKLRMAPCSR